MSGAQPIHAELIAVVVAVTAATPRVLTLLDGSALPAGPLESGHASLQAGLRSWVERRTGHKLGHIEQLYTFADPERSRAGRSISISYLALTGEPRSTLGGPITWQDWYQFFPWEDRRSNPDLINSTILPGLQRWIDGAPGRRSRASRCFGLDGMTWREDLTLARYELLYEAGLVRESANDGHKSHGTIPGHPMTADHRRILATAITRLRAGVRYRLAVFELMPPAFTLFDLQRCIEALTGQSFHKANFRRLIESQKLVEPTETLSPGAGRPARLFRFRPDIMTEHAQAGTRPPLARP